MTRAALTMMFIASPALAQLPDPAVVAKDLATGGTFTVMAWVIVAQAIIIGAMGRALWVTMQARITDKDAAHAETVETLTDLVKAQQDLGDMGRELGRTNDLMLRRVTA